MTVRCSLTLSSRRLLPEWRFDGSSRWPSPILLCSSRRTVTGSCDETTATTPEDDSSTVPRRDQDERNPAHGDVDRVFEDDQLGAATDQGSARSGVIPNP